MDGPPEQIFDHPRRENTRRFVRRLKVLELNVESRDYDFLGMAGEIKTWCGRNQIVQKLANRIRLVFEEAMGLLVPVLEEPRIQSVCEYSEQTESAEWTISYGGGRFDVTNLDDGLELAVLKGITERIAYEWNEDAGLPNQLLLKLKQ